jgi:hypothetical protein
LSFRISFFNSLFAGIKVTDFKLGVEVIRDGSGPSIASGFSPEQYQAAADAQSNPNVDLGIGFLNQGEPAKSNTGAE